MNWTIDNLILNLKYTWKIARGATDYKHNLLITVAANGRVGKGEVAPNTRYNEDVANTHLQFISFLDLVKRENIVTIEQLHYYIDKVNMNQSLKFGIEAAWVHLQLQSNPISEVFMIDPPTSLPTVFSIPILPSDQLATFISEHNIHRFKFLKIKIDATYGQELISTLATLTNAPLIIDANESFTEVNQLMKFQEAIQYPHVILIEQPLPAHQIVDYQMLKDISIYPIYGDESVIAQPNFDLLATQFHGINMKLMKAGGYSEGIRILKEAKRYGLKTMIGCMIESSLGIKSAFDIASLAEIHDLDGFLVVKDEPFGLLKELNGILYP